MCTFLWLGSLKQQSYSRCNFITGDFKSGKYWFCKTSNEPLQYLRFISNWAQAQNANGRQSTWHTGTLTALVGRVSLPLIAPLRTFRVRALLVRRGRGREGDATLRDCCRRPSDLGLCSSAGRTNTHYGKQRVRRAAGQNVQPHSHPQMVCAMVKQYLAMDLGA